MKSYPYQKNSNKSRNLLEVTKAAGRVALSVLKVLPHGAFVCFVLVLPIGFYTEDTDSSEVTIGAYGGTGQVASVLRGCGGIKHAEGSKFTDVGGSAYLTLPPGGQSPLIIGLRGGQWSSEVGFAGRLPDDSYGRINEVKAEFSYLNPNINLETKYIGLGIGFISGNVRKHFGSYEQDEGNNEYVKTSWHARLGNINKGYLMFSYAENTPLLSGGGFADLGIGYKLGKSARLFTGGAWGFYDNAGFVQQARINLNKRLTLDISLRLAEAGGISESAISGGINYSIDFSEKPRR